MGMFKLFVPYMVQVTPVATHGDLHTLAENLT
jgi:hypothetical protein